MYELDSSLKLSKKLSMLWALTSKKLVSVGIAGLFWVIWITRNNACFHHTRLTSPFGVIKRFCYWLNLWAVLLKKEENPSLLRWGTIFEAANG